MITLNSRKAALAAQLTADLERAELTRASVEQEALAGRMTADTLSRIDADRNLLRMRAETAQREADAELSGLAPEADITAAIDELIADKSLNVEPITEALENLRQAAAAVHDATAARDSSIRAWAKRLKDLGVPDEGMTVGETEIRMLASNRTGGAPRIMVGEGEISETFSAGRYVKQAVAKYAHTTESPIEADELNRHDQRQTIRDEPIKIKMVRARGGNAVGSILTSRHFSNGVLARLVHTGDAELISGNIGTPDLSTQIVNGMRDKQEDRQLDIAISQSIAAGAH